MATPAPAPSPAQGDQHPNHQEYGPIFFHKEDQEYGFFSNFYKKSFSAPNPKLWLFEQPENIATALSNINAHVGGRGPDSLVFLHSEQYYMYCKAIYFGDEDAARKILTAVTPTECKDLGRSVRGYNDKAWERHDLKIRVMEAALWWKFGGAQLTSVLDSFRGRSRATKRAIKDKALDYLGKELLATGDRQLVEAAGRDRYWGIGYSIKQGPQLYEQTWGRNQLGKSLMAVRGRLRELLSSQGEQEEEKEETTDEEERAERAHAAWKERQKDWDSPEQREKYAEWRRMKLARRQEKEGFNDLMAEWARSEEKEEKAGRKKKLARRQEKGETADRKKKLARRQQKEEKAGREKKLASSQEQEEKAGRQKKLASSQEKGDQPKLMSFDFDVLPDADAESD